ncbi:F-box and leucine-rich repeat protein 13-like isoform X1 [Artemia franciscana]
MEESMKTEERLEGLWSCLPEEVIRAFYEYLNFRDVEAASQTCKSWYAAFINNSKIHNNIEFLINQKHSQALADLSRYPSRCKRIRIEGFGWNTTDIEWEQVLDCWKIFSDHVNHLRFSKCKINERQIENFLCYCTSLVSLTVDYCHCDNGDTDSVCDLINLVSVTHLEIKDSGIKDSPYKTDKSLIKLTNFMPKLVHLSLSLMGCDYIPIYDLEGQMLPRPEYNLVRIVEPKFATIVSISFGHNCISRDQLVCLLKVPDMRLISLNLNGIYAAEFIDDTVINAIATHQTEIVHLFINRYFISNESFNLLCRHLEKLETLHLYGIRNALSRVCLLEFLIYFKELRTLKIEDFGPKPTILQRLLDKPLDMHLTHLDINFPQGHVLDEREPAFNNAKMCLRFVASRLLKLTFLRLRSCPLDNNLFREITTNLVNLVVLRVENCTGFNFREIYHYAPPFRHLKRLTELELSKCIKVSDVFLDSAFTSCCLKKLSLRHCIRITDCGLVKLAAQPESFKRSIEELNLSGCYQVTDWGLSKLLPELKRLRVLNLKGCRKVTSKMLETVKTYCPKLRHLCVEPNSLDTPLILDTFFADYDF